MPVRRIAFLVSLIFACSPALAEAVPVHGKCKTSNSELVPAAHSIEWWLDKGERGEARITRFKDVYDGVVVAQRPHGEGWKINIRFMDNSLGESLDTELAVFTVADSYMMIGADFQEIDGERVLHSISTPTEILCITE